MNLIHFGTSQKDVKLYQDIDNGLYPNEYVLTKEETAITEGTTALKNPNENDGTEEPDMVNHPPHYNQYKGFEVIDIVEQMDYLRGTAIKYIMRAGSKWNTIQDIDKAIWYLQRFKTRLTNQK